MNGRDQQFSSAQVAARALFSCGITAVVVISTYYGMLWLFARADYRQAGARSMMLPYCGGGSPDWVKVKNRKHPRCSGLWKHSDDHRSP